MPRTLRSHPSDRAGSTKSRATEHTRRDLLQRDLQKYTELIISILTHPSLKLPHYACCSRLPHMRIGTLIKWMSPRHISTASCLKGKSSTWKCLPVRITLLELYVALTERCTDSNNLEDTGTSR